MVIQKEECEMKQEREKKVLWISRHTLTDGQLEDLERALRGPVRVLSWTGTVKDVGDLRPLVGQSDAVAAVLPMEKLAQILSIAGERPVLQAKGDRVPTGRWAVSAEGTPEREFAFVHRGWQQILDIQIRTRPL